MGEWGSAPVAVGHTPSLAHILCLQTVWPVFPARGWLRPSSHTAHTHPEGASSHSSSSHGGPRCCRARSWWGAFLGNSSLPEPEGPCGVGPRTHRETSSVRGCGGGHAEEGQGSRAKGRATALPDRNAEHGQGELAGTCCVASGSLKSISGLLFPMCKVTLQGPAGSQGSPGFLRQGWGGEGGPSEAQAGGEVPARGTSEPWDLP